MIYRRIGLGIGMWVLLATIVFLTKTAVADTETTHIQYLPIISTSFPTSFSSPFSTPLPAPIALVNNSHDFSQIVQNLRVNGFDLSYNKIGFHTGVGGNAQGLGEWMTTLDQAGVPFFLKSVDDAGVIYEAQELMKKSGVPHTLVYRRTGLGYDLPDYSLSPEDAAINHWDRHIAVFPPELDKSLVWLETVNEVDKNRSEWLGQFALKTAELAMRDGYKWAAFGWSSGEPESVHWEGPEMLAFLRYAAARPERIAIALHEYSYTRDEIGRWYPYLIGRFQQLYQICDERGIERPTVLITEWGWEYQDIPDVNSALEDIKWAAKLYAAYPQVKGAAIWYLGGYFGDIHHQTQKLIAPMASYSETHYFEVASGKWKIDAGVLAPAGRETQLPLFEEDLFREQYLEPVIATPR